MNWQDIMLKDRFKDLILSVYLYNEWRGYTQLEGILIPQLEANPVVSQNLLNAVRSHAQDEKKHYQMFKDYFRTRNKMPFKVGKSVGYFDLLVTLATGKKEALIENEKRFAKICRLVVLTENRGLTQIRAILRWPWIRSDKYLMRVFQVIEKDEPSHFNPYQEWLRKRDLPGPTPFEKAADLIAHYGIALVIIPFHFLNFRLKRANNFWA